MNANSKDRYVYGPVPSRRLGRSLGIDLVPFKTCSYDCIYCQLGRTTHKTIELAEYVPTEAVLDELARKLATGPAPNYIGLAGSGEPTLHSRIGELVAAIKEMTAIPVAVLTNGSLLWRPEVRSAIAQADLVMPSLDAGDPRTFARVNRPHRRIEFEKMTEGLITFAEEYRGAIWLEVFVVGGFTDSAEAVEKIAAIAEKMHPERVQLNTVSRPPAEDSALAVSAKALEQIRAQFSGTCEVIAEERQFEPTDSPGPTDIEEEILVLLSRRPCTVDGIATGLELRPNEVIKALDLLCQKGAVRTERRGESLFYERARQA
ncbi:MAG: radical SAM protein [Bradymonadales bacterium]|nr:radical SAM protein [Bradymonadales bacterium]